MRIPINIISGMILTLTTLGGCSSGEKTDVVGSGGTGGAATADLGDTVLARSRCGSVQCGSWNTCCLGEKGDVCGLALPTNVFAESCVLKEQREGALDSTCAESRDYCPESSGNPCIYPGCRRADGACGFLVDGFWVLDNGVGILDQYAGFLGCMAVAEFVP